MMIMILQKTFLGQTYRWAHDMRRIAETQSGPASSTAKQNQSRQRNRVERLLSTVLVYLVKTLKTCTRYHFDA